MENESNNTQPVTDITKQDKYTQYILDGFQWVYTDDHQMENVYLYLYYNFIDANMNHILWRVLQTTDAWTQEEAKSNTKSFLKSILKDYNNSFEEFLTKNPDIDSEASHYALEILRKEIEEDNILSSKEYSDSELENIWDELTDVPFDENDDGELILSVDWRQFSKGTSRTVIWEFFDEKHSKGVAWLLYEYVKE